MLQISTNKIIFALSTAIIVLSFQNCGQNGFETVDSYAKEDFLKNAGIFKPGTYDNLDQEVLGTEEDDADLLIDTEVTNSAFGEQIPVEYFCSTQRYTGHKRVSQVVNIFYVVKNSAGQTVCDEKIDQRYNIQTVKNFEISKDCLKTLIPNENYAIYLESPESPGTIGNLGSDPVVEVSAVQPLFKFNNGKFTYTGKFQVFYDFNPELTSSVTHNKCDTKASPLIVALGKYVKHVHLTSQIEGITFDILGANSKPAPHTPKQISWFASARHGYYFIALPDENGEIRGIDQLFGDNTMGPDGKTASNGYEALAKFDKNKDGYITRGDAIFSKLRLWHDTDLNGKSKKSELYTLDQMSIVSIDLVYDKKYYEVDQYGNETKMKSVVKTKDGNLHLLFDLWFRYL